MNYPGILGDIISIAPFALTHCLQPQIIAPKSRPDQNEGSIMIANTIQFPLCLKTLCRERMDPTWMVRLISMIWNSKQSTGLSHVSPLVLFLYEVLWTIKIPEKQVCKLCWRQILCRFSCSLHFYILPQFIAGLASELVKYRRTGRHVLPWLEAYFYSGEELVYYTGRSGLSILVYTPQVTCQTLGNLINLYASLSLVSAK